MALGRHHSPHNTTPYRGDTPTPWHEDSPRLSRLLLTEYKSDHNSGKLVAVSRSVVEDGAAITRVMYWPDDGTFLFLDSDAPDDPGADYEPDLVVLCLDCLLENGGGALGRGMDVARRAGEARYVDGVWQEWGD